MTKTRRTGKKVFRMGGNFTSFFRPHFSLCGKKRIFFGGCCYGEEK